MPFIQCRLLCATLQTRMSASADRVKMAALVWTASTDITADARPSTSDYIASVLIH